LLQTEFEENLAAVSPDGNWIAFESDQSGRSEVYVRPFPDLNAGGQWQLSSEGGRWPRWSADSSQITFRGTRGTAPDAQVWSVSVETDPVFNPGNPTLLFEGNYRGSGGAGSFAMAGDGNRFLLIRGPTADDYSNEDMLLFTVENWFAELNRPAPPDSQ